MEDGTDNRQRKAYIEKALEPYCFKSIDIEDFDYWAGAFPPQALETFKAALDDFACMLDIARSDIGMNGQITLKLGINPENAKYKSLGTTAGYSNLDTNTLCLRAYNSQTFAHEWGHLFDKYLGCHNKGVPFDAPLTHVSQGNRGTNFSEYYLFPQEFLFRTKDFIKNVPLEYGAYLMRKNELFARCVEMVPSLMCMNPEYDLTVLSRDARDPDMLSYEGKTAIRPDQHLFDANGVPCPSGEETVNFLSDLGTWIFELKHDGVFHDTDVTYEEAIGKQIDKTRGMDILGATNTGAGAAYINNDEAVTIQRIIVEQLLKNPPEPELDVVMTDAEAKATPCEDSKTEIEKDFER